MGAAPKDFQPRFSSAGLTLELYPQGLFPGFETHGLLLPCWLDHPILLRVRSALEEHFWVIQEPVLSPPNEEHFWNVTVPKEIHPPYLVNILKKKLYDTEE